MNLLRKILITIALLLLPFILYGLGATLGLLILFKGKPQYQYPIYISSGYIHTEFVFDLERSPFNWREFLPPASVNLHAPARPRFISLGQGDKRFFYEYLAADDLTFELAFQGALIPSATAIHVEYSERLNPNLRHYLLMTDEEQYLKLVHYVLKSFRLESGRPIKVDDFNYFGRDGFFWGSESYHLFNTCNMWTARGLDVAQLPYPLWAPFRYSIDRALKDYEINPGAID